jgi:hypothetical protein
MEPATDAERTAELREQCRINDLRDLRGPEFLRLLSLAHSEGLLDELIRDNAFLHHQAEHHRLLLGASGRLTAPEIQSNSQLFARLDRRQDAYKLRSGESSFPSIPCAVSVTSTMIEAIHAQLVARWDQIEYLYGSEAESLANDAVEVFNQVLFPENVS